MRRFRICTDLERADIDGFRLPLGLVPDGAEAPAQGYTVDYVPANGADDDGGEDEDVYTFHAVVSHERVQPLVRRFFDLLPDQVTPILEVGSRDAYRSVDVYLGRGPISRDDFLRVWKQYESFILEDGSVTVGANGEDPFVEVCLDHAKGLAVHVPPSMRDAVDAMLRDAGLDEVPVTWPRGDDEAQGLKTRSVLEIVDAFSPDLDELILQLRAMLDLELDVDPDSNVDEAGRELGHTLWHAMAIVEDGRDPDHGAYASVWATARSLNDMEALIERAVEEGGQWQLADIFTIDRIAYDERPDELVDLAPRYQSSAVHLVQFDEWTGSEEGGGEGDDAPGADAAHG